MILRAGRLGDHRRLADVPAAQGRERAQPAVLLADHAVHRERTLQRTPASRRVRSDGQVGGHPGLHVAGAAPEQRAVADLRGERVGAEPVVGVAGRYDVEVALEHQAGHPLAGPRASRPRRRPRARAPRRRGTTGPAASSSRSMSQRSTSVSRSRSTSAATSCTSISASVPPMLGIRTSSIRDSVSACSSRWPRTARSAPVSSSEAHVASLSGSRQSWSCPNRHGHRRLQSSQRNSRAATSGHHHGEAEQDRHRQRARADGPSPRTITSSMPSLRCRSGSS